MRALGSDWDRTIVLVADPVDEAAIGGSFDRRIDRPREATVAELAVALRPCCDRLIRISDITEFSDRIGRLSRSLVFPYWFGQTSRSRHGLVPAICEANGVMYVGADAFAKIVCNDKELSKAVCAQSRLATPPSAVITSVGDLQYAHDLPLPVMVKPNYEGSSLGISEKNKCATWSEAETVATELINNLGQPIILEEFIEGREFSACLMDNADGSPIVSIGAWKIDGREDYLDDRVNSWELKRDDDIEMKFELIDDRFSSDDLAAMRDCFSRLGCPGLLRIDGRLTPGGPVILELTPDIYLGSDGEFAEAFIPIFGNFEALISLIVTNCVKRYRADVPMR